MLDRNQQIEAELGALRRYARALAATSDDANELVQQAVVRALARWPQWRGDGSLKSWLFSILRNTHLQEARRRARWRLVDLDAVPASAEPTAPTAVDPLFLRDMGVALATLTDEQRETLFLVAVEGLSYAEAAALTETPVGTVMSRLSRARSRLRSATGGL